MCSSIRIQLCTKCKNSIEKDSQIVRDLLLGGSIPKKQK